MSKIVKLITEMINDYDFLGHEKMKKEESHNQLLSSKEFQTSFVGDILNNCNKDFFPKASAVFIKNEPFNKFDEEIALFEFQLDFIYRYAGKKISLILFIEGDVADDKIDFETCEFKLFSKGGEEIQMKWIENNENLYNAFLKTIVKYFINR